ncbi:tRNA-binding protein [Flammeovirga yaeyamensis]|uniref:tRNA-binding protein n=1 Tax=Flammeovirga yaeyamensis TaxID=367791 RepID=A0AAX1MZG2_9BACT|nr:tRNA-binding protein [Flammeovirga yaeyamensis]MBB3700875.1 tRNA-binding protein [Flammeovirga yaeyamensis]NMF37983.1 tRNA-binding protein [Flammeovirga yaeyamensis]QWG00634.1 tRNA-binding protein [Flammeovirga yaeyamensis]
MIGWDDFTKIDMRVGTIIHAEVFEEVRNPAYKLKIDFGEDIGVKKSSAQITKVYQPKELVGKQVVAVVNFPPKQIANFMSECLVMGAIGEDKEVNLITMDNPVANGQKIG